VSTTAPNTQLGKYQLVRQIAAGEMTELWLGLDGERKVALKRIRAEFGDDKKYVGAFAEQARRAAILHHEHIARINDVSPPTGEVFYAMDWIEGIDLRAVLADAHTGDQQIRIEHVLTIMLATCDAFQYAHKKGIFHLDVSPANILIGFDGTVKVIDFGIATAVNRAKTRPGAQEGKVGYMSPELCLGKSADARSDIFSLGVVLYELLTVRRLFKAATDFLTMSTIIEGQVPRPSTIRPGIAPELEEIVMKALENPREARYQNAAEMRTALERFCVANKLVLSRESLADYARGLAEKRERAASNPKATDPGEDRAPAVISGTVETSTKLRSKTAGGNDSTLIIRPITVSPPPRTKKLAFLAIGAIAALAIVGITIYVLQPTGDTPTTTAEPAPPPQPPAPAIAQPAPAPDAAVTDDLVEVDVVKPDDEPPPDPPALPEPKKAEEPRPIVKLREPEPVAPKKKVVKPRPKPAPHWDPNALFPEKK
jgi:serine/threonine protein kinase